jgi:hypothetical protein
VSVRASWLGAIGLCLVVIVLMLAFEQRVQYYPVVVILAGCLALAVVLVPWDGSGHSGW